MPRDPLEKDRDQELGTVLAALADDDCRALLETMDRPMSAAELSDRSDVPLSTTYRKIDWLAKATLVDERIEIRDDGRHTSHYVPDFDRIEIAREDDQRLIVDIARPPRTADERLVDLWAAVRKGV